MSETVEPEVTHKSRLLFLAFLSILFVLVCAAVVLPFWAQEARYDGSLSALSRIRRELATRPVLEAALTRFKGRIGMLSSLYRASGSALVAAAMQTDLKQISQASSADTRSMEMLSLRKNGPFEIISLAGETTLPESHLGDFLYRVETHHPDLVFETLDISSASAGGAEPVALEPRLSLRWTLHGTRWRGSK